MDYTYTDGLVGPDSRGTLGCILAVLAVVVAGSWGYAYWRQGHPAVQYAFSAALNARYHAWAASGIALAGFVFLFGTARSLTLDFTAREVVERRRVLFWVSENRSSLAEYQRIVVSPVAVARGTRTLQTDTYYVVRLEGRRSARLADRFRSVEAAEALALRLAGPLRLPAVLRDHRGLQSVRPGGGKPPGLEMFPDGQTLRDWPITRPTNAQPPAPEAGPPHA